MPPAEPILVTGASGFIGSHMARRLAGTGAGFGIATGDFVEGVPRLRFQVSTATDFASATLAGRDAAAALARLSWRR